MLGDSEGLNGAGPLCASSSSGVGRVEVGWAREMGLSRLWRVCLSRGLVTFFLSIASFLMIARDSRSGIVGQLLSTFW